MTVAHCSCAMLALLISTGLKGAVKSLKNGIANLKTTIPPVPFSKPISRSNQNIPYSALSTWIMLSVFLMPKKPNSSTNTSIQFL